MNCRLCDQPIEKYSSEFNHLIIDEFHSADLCSACIDKFLKWQRHNFATLFPTKAAKKWSGKKKSSH
ncbi:MAG: hypothetical protein JEY91_01985 [Spirochaetaceae bacterium]|nr:hypothetical protein [Spirochaetaceae bacterium]